MTKSSYITTSQGMGGWFAVIIWWNNEDPAMEFWEPWDTGIGRYGSQEEAAAEAIEWSQAENLPYHAWGSPLPKECQ